MINIKKLFIFLILFIFSMQLSAQSVSADSNVGGKCSLYVSQKRNGDTCYSSGCMTTASTTIEVEGLEDGEGNPFNGKVRFVITGSADKFDTAKNGSASATFNADKQKSYKIHVEETAWFNEDFPGCSTTFNAASSCEENQCDENKTDVSSHAIEKPFELCEQIIDIDERGKCNECFSGSGSGDDGGVWTAIGCIPANPESIIKTIITLGLSTGGGATLLLILAGAFRLSVSQGDAQATKEAKEQITSAIIGLIFIIMSITILRFIGVSLFQIPGFGG